MRSRPIAARSRSARLSAQGRGCIAIELNGRPEQKIDHVLEGLGATAPGDPRLRINMNLLMRTRSARQNDAGVRNLTDAIERLRVGVKPAEQVVDCLAHRPCRLCASLDEAGLDAVALGAPLVLYREGAVDGTEIRIQLGVIEQMPRQAAKKRRDAKPILNPRADVGDAQLEGRMP